MNIPHAMADANPPHPLWQKEAGQGGFASLNV